MYSTEQEKFWSGEFGTQYTERNNSEKILAIKINFLSKIINRTDAPLKSIIEYGTNRGLNLQALKILSPETELSGLEINDTAFNELKKLSYVNAIKGSLLEYTNEKTYDLVLISGVLIHLNPESLDKAYTLLYNSSHKYIIISEYYNPTPVTVNYRGNNDVLFKRDFAGEMMDKYPDLKLVDYGFGYHRDNNFPTDDGTWFLLEKKG